MSKGKSGRQQGGGFLVDDANLTDLFIPEDLTLEQRELSKTVHDFVVNEIISKDEDIELMRPGLMPKLLKEAAKLGLLMAEVPVEYGGLGLGKVDSAAIADGSTLQGSFNVAYMCHTGISTAPLTYYGTDAQKKKYLEKLATGEMLAAFALTEAEAGSDAMAITTRAVFDTRKNCYILNGVKHFITNGGFADLITVFAKVGEKGITAFLVEKNFSGITVGKEEKKMGIHGSSTVEISFDNVEVPAENLLGEIGKGHHIAFNVLNAGRLKLGGACVGAGRHLINLTYNYVSERSQFGNPLISFQMIQQKLAMMVARNMLLESLVFRAAGWFDESIQAAAKDKEKRDVLREYAIEAAIAKVFGSEALFNIADEAVQLHGGYGYCEEYGIEKYFRDSRINRIFEGTNEINRLVITGTLLKLAVTGKIDILGSLSKAPATIKKLLTTVDKNSEESVIYAFIEVSKRLILSIGAAGAQKYGNEISNEEYIIGNLADMMMEVYAIESAYLRARKLANKCEETRSKNIYDCLYLYLLQTAAAILDKGRLMVMRVAGEGAKEVDDYFKTMCALLSAIRGDQQKLAIGVIDEIDNVGGYPY